MVSTCFFLHNRVVNNTSKTDLNHHDEPWLYRMQFLIRPSHVTLVSVGLLVFLIGVACYLSLAYLDCGPFVEIDSQPTRTAAYVVDLNSADASEFANLAGIGDVLADAIVEYRQSNGPFEDVEALDDVFGIGQAKMKKLRQYLVITPPSGQSLK